MKVLSRTCVFRDKSTNSSIHIYISHRKLCTEFLYERSLPTLSNVSLSTKVAPKIISLLTTVHHPKYSLLTRSLLEDLALLLPYQNPDRFNICLLGPKKSLWKEF